MKLSDAIVVALKTMNVRYVFGVSGANIEHLHDAITRIGGNELTAILSKSESGAAFMADAHARVHKTLGVCCATSGGGMLNLLPGLAEAYAESVPVFAIIGQAPLTLEGRGAFQDSSLWEVGPNALDLIRATTKWSYRLERAADFWNAIAQCFRYSLSGRQGPTALLIPRDLYEQEVEELDVSLLLLKAVCANPGASALNIDRFFEVLSHAERPSIVLGHGVSRSLSASDVVKFCEATKIPVATTLSARDLIPHDASNYLGMIGAAGHPSVHDFLARDTDLIIAIGTGLSVMARGPLGASLAKKRLLAINLEEDSLLRFAPHAEVIKADAGLFFAVVNSDERSKNLSHRGSKNYRLTVLKPTVAPYEISSQSREYELTQSNAIASIEKIFPIHGHLLFDAGNCAAAALHWTHVPKGSSSTIALGMGTMGYAIGGAIGAQLGSAKGSRTVSIVGDGAFLMCGLEIHTAIEMQLPILFIVFNNAAHGMCVTRQALYFEGRQACSTYHEFSASKVVEGLAGEMPCFVASVTNIAELENALREYQNHTQIPGVLEIRGYKEEWPPFAPFFKEVGATLECKSTFAETLGFGRDK